MVSIIQAGLFLAFFLVVATSIFLTSLFRFKTIVPYLLSVYLLSFADILLTGELAGLFGLLASRFFFLSVHFIILSISFILWKKTGAPSLFNPLINLWKTIRSINPLNVFKKHPLICILGVGVGITYLVSAIVIFKVPPNNYDSMTCHMARIGYWLQNGNFLPWPTWFTLQVDYPINAQVEILWSILFWRTDAFAGFTQWFASLFSILVIYGIARLLKRTRAQSIFASLIYALFPQILLQSTTTMPHLLGATLTVISFYFLFLAFTEKRKIFFIFSGLAIGLAIGVHLIVVIMVPGYAISALYLSIKHRKEQLNALKWIIISSAISFLLFSSYIYIQNYVLWRQPFGRFAAHNPWALQNSIKPTDEENYWLPQNVSRYTYYNASKYIFASYDLTGLPENTAKPFYKIRDWVFIPFFEMTGIPLHLGEFNIDARVPGVSENWAWFGLVGFMLFYPLLIIETINAVKKKDATKAQLIISILLYVFLWSTFLSRKDGWTMYAGRYFVPEAILFAPFIAIVYRKGIASKVICSVLVLLSLFIGYQTMLLNYAKPLTSYGAILNWSRTDKIFSTSWDQNPVGVVVEKYVPRNGILGLALTPSLMEYPYFGEYFKRTLIPIFPYENMQNEQWLNEKHIDWILSCVDFAGKPEGFAVVETIPFTYPIGISTECSLYNRN